MAYRYFPGIFPVLALLAGTAPALAIEPASCDVRVKSQTQQIAMDPTRAKAEQLEMRSDNCLPAKTAVSPTLDLKKATSAVLNAPSSDSEAMPNKTSNPMVKSARPAHPRGYGQLHDNLTFRYRLYRPENASAQTIVLLHGSGANETSLVPLARKINPRATLLAVRGRVVQEGSNRWYKRITPVSFDQTDIRAEADAFVDFISKASSTYDIDMTRTVFLGYSNGANLLSSVMLLHPGLVKNAVLLRSMPVLNEIPDANLGKTNVLVIAGDKDATYAPFAPELAAILTKSGARVDARTIPSTHAVGDEDARLVSEWLESSVATAAKLP